MGGRRRDLGFGCEGNDQARIYSQLTVINKLRALLPVGLAADAGPNQEMGARSTQKQYSALKKVMDGWNNGVPPRQKAGHPSHLPYYKCIEITSHMCSLGLAMVAGKSVATTIGTLDEPDTH